jgi:DNA polymerase-3 subunit epsilon
MKSQLKKFNKIKNQPLAAVTGAMHLSEDHLYELMRMWIDQGHLSHQDPLYVELRDKRQARRQAEIRKRQKKELTRYQGFIDSGMDMWEAAKAMKFSRLKLEHFQSKWYELMRREDLADDVIARELRMKAKEYNTLKHACDSERKLKEEAAQKRLSFNRQYAVTHLQGIRRDIEEGTRNYLIFDIEAVQCPDEPIEISIIDCLGNTVFDSLIRPTNPINWRIEKLTGITNEMVADKDDIFAVMPVIKALTANSMMLSWGSDYDAVLFRTACETTHIDLDCTFGCAQRIHMGVLGAKDQIALGTAAGASTQNHRALDDCRMVLDIIKRDLALYGDALLESASADPA